MNLLYFVMAAQERNVDILLLSRDSDFIDMARGYPGIMPFELQIPSLSNYTLSIRKWYFLIQFIYILAVHYGLIQLQGGAFDFLLLGIWRGKSNDDWRNESLKLIINRKSDYMMNMVKDIRILQEMKWEYE